MSDLTDVDILALFKDAPEDCTHYDYYYEYFDITYIDTLSYTKVTKDNYYYWSWDVEWKELSAKEVADLKLIKRPDTTTQETKKVKYVTSTQETKEMKDNIKNPSHYQILEGIESIEIIANSMTREAFHGYCLGNIIKYRLRAGNKDDLAQDIGKADFYKELYDIHNRSCR